MAETAKVVVLDHHKSAQKDLDGVEFAQFDMNRSGAQMAWDYFHPNEPRPVHIEHIGDRDLWKFEKADTKAYSIAAMSKIKQFTDLNTWKSHELIEIGRDLLDFQNSQVPTMIFVQGLYSCNLVSGTNFSLICINPRS
jgi:oligoribonuclease NrnB/cAMP/cGMP phosphodiesterase (DHH superfamily)